MLQRTLDLSKKPARRNCTGETFTAMRAGRARGGLAAGLYADPFADAAQ